VKREALRNPKKQRKQFAAALQIDAKGPSEDAKSAMEEEKGLIGDNPRPIPTFSFSDHFDLGGLGVFPWHLGV
jgi:hypothetical protein